MKSYSLIVASVFASSFVHVENALAQSSEALVAYSGGGGG